MQTLAKLSLIVILASVAHAQQPTVLPAPAQQPAAQQTAALPEPTGPQPSAVLNMEEWDFGTKWYAEPAEGEVEITNAGDAVLKIVNIRSSCGCTVPAPRSFDIAPGESRTFTVKYDTRKRKEKVSQTITVLTNDPKRPSIPVRIKGIVKEVVTAKPTMRINFPRITKDQIDTRTLTLENNLEQPINLELTPAPQGVPFNAELKEIEKGRKWELRTTTVPPLKDGANNYNIRIRTDAEKQKEVTVPVMAYVRPRITVSPQKLYVSSRMQQSLDRIVRIMYTQPDDFKIEKIETSPEGIFTAELMPPRVNARASRMTPSHEIRVSLPPGDQMPDRGAKLVIHTNDKDPQYARIEIDIVKRTVNINRGVRRGIDPRQRIRAGGANTRRALTPGGKAVTVPAGDDASKDKQSNDKAENDNKADTSSNASTSASAGSSTKETPKKDVD